MRKEKVKRSHLLMIMEWLEILEHFLMLNNNGGMSSIRSGLETSSKEDCVLASCWFGFNQRVSLHLSTIETICENDLASMSKSMMRPYQLSVNLDLGRQWRN